MPHDRDPSHRHTHTHSHHRRRSSHAHSHTRVSPAHLRRQQTEILEALARIVLHFTVQRYAENRQREQRPAREGGSSSRSRGDRSHHPDPSDVARLLLAQLVQYLVHRYMTARHRRESSTSRPDNAAAAPPGAAPLGAGSGPISQPVMPPTHAPPSPPLLPQLPSYSGGRVLSERDVQYLLSACDDLLSQLQSTEELVRRTVYRPASHEGCRYHRSVIENADALHVSIGSAAAGARRVREVVLVYRERGGRGREGGRERRGSAAEYYEGGR